MNTKAQNRLYFVSTCRKKRKNVVFFMIRLDLKLETRDCCGLGHFLRKKNVNCEMRMRQEPLVSRRLSRHSNKKGTMTTTRTKRIYFREENTKRKWGIINLSMGYHVSVENVKLSFTFHGLLLSKKGEHKEEKDFFCVGLQWAEPLKTFNFTQHHVIHYDDHLWLSSGINSTPISHGNIEIHSVLFFC